MRIYQASDTTPKKQKSLKPSAKRFFLTLGRTLPIIESLVRLGHLSEV
jgi:hypothetical protein